MFIKDAIIHGKLYATELICKQENFHDKFEFYDKQLSRINIPELQNVICELLKKEGVVDSSFKITVDLTSAFATNSMYGHVNFINKNEIKIVINERLTRCWQRFVMIKELCQIYCDLLTQSEKETSYNIADIKGQISSLLKSMKKVDYFMRSTDPDFESYFDDEDDTEVTSIVMAINLTYHSEKEVEDSRELYLDSINERNDIRIYDIAKEYLMPEYIIKTYHSHLYKKYLDLQQ